MKNFKEPQNFRIGGYVNIGFLKDLDFIEPIDYTPAHYGIAIMLSMDIIGGIQSLILGVLS